MQPVQYISTRGAAPALDFEATLLTGLARDGGLYVPRTWPILDAGDLRSLRGLPYPDLAARVMQPFLGDAIDPDGLRYMAYDAYARFDHPAVVPLIQIDHRIWLMELFRGPTLAFKDVALQLLGRLFEHVLARRRERITIVGATSGDTGSAAIEAVRGRENMDIFILFPKGRTSEVQRRQMTTVDDPNVHTIAVEGTFDDCQAMVKAMFADQHFRDHLRLSAVNSINWARLMAQTAYYVAAATALGVPGRWIAFAVPTGNFGNVYAAYAARKMGLPVARLMVGTNRNDILTRFFASGTMAVDKVVPTDSPSMDIQVSSNFERLLFDLCQSDGAWVGELMEGFRKSGRFHVTPEQLTQAAGLFSAHAVDDAATRRTIADVHEKAGMLIDPHTAVGVAAARALIERGEVSRDVPVVVMGCAHPAKFGPAVMAATGIQPTLPPRLADLATRPEHYTVLPNDLAEVQRFIMERARAGAEEGR